MAEIIADGPPELSTMRQLIQDKAGALSYDDRLHVLEILKQHLPPSKIIENADGSRINLDIIDHEIIKKIFHIITIKSEAQLAC